MVGPAGPPLFNGSYRYLHPDASKCLSLQLEVSLRTCISEGHPVKNWEVFSCENAGSGTGTLSSCSFAVTCPRLLEAPTTVSSAFFLLPGSWPRMLSVADLCAHCHAVVFHLQQLLPPVSAALMKL